MLATVSSIQEVLQTVGIFGGLLVVLVTGYFGTKRLVRINAAAEAKDLIEEKDRTIAANQQSIEALETRVRTLRTDVDRLTTDYAHSNKKINEMADKLREAHDAYRQLEQFAAPHLVPRLTEAFDSLTLRIEEVLDQVAIIAKRDFAIRNSEILESMGDAVLLVHMRTSNIEYANRAAAKIFGYERADELMDKPLDTLIPERLRRLHRDHRRLFAEQPEQRLMGERTAPLLGLRADGSEFPVQIALSPLDKRVVVVVRDATPAGRRIDDPEIKPESPGRALLSSDSG